MQPQRRLSIVIPFFNEERTLGALIDRVHSACPFAEIILVDDGSTDTSLTVAQSRVRKGIDRVFTKSNEGKGSAVRLGFAHATGTYVIVQDADLEYDPKEILPLLERAETDALPAVYGSRRLRGRPPVAHIKYYIGGVLLTHYVNLLYGTRLTDQNTCYKLVRTDLVRSFPFRHNDFRFDCEMTVFLRRHGHHILELPISYAPRTAAEGKKIGYSDWVRSLWLLTVMRCRPRHDVLFLLGVSVALFLLWLPNLRYPIVSDSMEYAHLSQNFWTTLSYQLQGVPHRYHLPLFPIMSYWSIALFGFNYGLKVASLLYGIVMYILVFSFVRILRPTDRVTPVLTLSLLLLSFPTVWLLSLGNADTFFAVLFFAALISYLKAQARPRLYLLSGLFIGLASLSRYPGLTLIPIIGLHALLTRRKDFRSAYFWFQFLIAFGLFSVWPMRNALLFGSLRDGHLVNEFNREGDLLGYIWHDLLYYLNPMHSILLFAVPAAWGLMRYGRRHLLVSIAIPGSMLLALIYHAVTVRFMIVTIPLLLFFAALGVQDAWQKWPRLLILPFLVVALSVQASLVCFYSLPQCHAWIDRLTIPRLPKDFGWTQEGFESFQEAVDWVGRAAPVNAELSEEFIGDPLVWENFHRLRSDVAVRTRFSCERPAYVILAPDRNSMLRVPEYMTRNHPQFSVYALTAAECAKYSASEH
ncbi:glycosyltransferase [Candidatus Peregrinibacteria bacterium]|nr:glycosyltransferase [Candidatus Peregrinibacteria bacterium]